VNWAELLAKLLTAYVQAKKDAVPIPVVAKPKPEPHEYQVTIVQIGGQPHCWVVRPVQAQTPAMAYVSALFELGLESLPTFAVVAQVWDLTENREVQFS